MTDMTGDTHRKSGRIGVIGGLQENTVEHMRKVKSQVTTASEPHAQVFRENKQLCPSLRGQSQNANQELKEKKKTEEKKKQKTNASTQVRTEDLALTKRAL